MQLSIGHRLAGARRARGLSILDVSHKTRISPSNIRYIECDNFAQCPNLVYAKGFLKLLDRFLDAGLQREIASFDTGPTITSSAVLISVPDTPHPVSASVVANVSETRPAFIGLMIGILLIVTLPVAAIKWHDRSQPQTAAPQAATPRTPALNAAAQTPTPAAKLAINLPHIPYDAPPELAAISNFEDNVDLDELSPPALPATQPVPTAYSSPAIASLSPPATARSNPVRATTPADAGGQTTDKKKSFFSRMFGSKRR